MLTPLWPPRCDLSPARATVPPYLSLERFRPPLNDGPSGVSRAAAGRRTGRPPWPCRLLALEASREESPDEVPLQAEEDGQRNDDGNEGSGGIQVVPCATGS